MLDMSERDLLLSDKSSPTEPVFDSVWGSLFDEDARNDVLICNIIIPEAYWKMAKYTDNEVCFRFTASYKPVAATFRIRPVALKNGNYNLFSGIRGDFGIPVSSYALSRNIAAPINASMLPYVDIDGEFTVKLVKSELNELLDKAYIYSSKATDITIGYSDDQASQLLSICNPGNSYRYPTTGVGITKYLNSVVAHSDLEDVLEKQFNSDSKPIKEADFDNETCRLDVIATPEQEQSDTGLDSIENMAVDFFSLFDDEYVRRNIVLNELSDVDFLSLLNDYPYILELFIFIDDTTTSTRITSNVEAGAFDADGNIIQSEDYYIVTATVDSNSIVMFDDESEDEVKDAPIFIINDDDQSRIYTALIEQPYWITAQCHKCMVLKERSTIKYMIRQDKFLAGNGLYIIPQTSSNLKNIAGLVQDENTGRLLGVISNNTNISDMTLDEITQHIYATQVNS